MVNNSYKNWLKELSNGREFFEELTKEEIYQIIQKVVEVSYIKTKFYLPDKTNEDIVDSIFLYYFSIDYEKNLDIVSNIKTEEYPYYDERTGMYFKNWRPRSEVKGFQRMINRKMTILHFSNLVFREVRNHIAWYLRDKKNIFNNNLMSIEDDFYKTTYEDILEDTKSSYSMENILSIRDISRYIKLYLKEDKIIPNYYIKYKDSYSPLNYSSLLKLYCNLAWKNTVNSVEILEYIKCSDNSVDKKFIVKYIKEFKEFLLENNFKEFIGGEKYGYAQ